MAAHHQHMGAPQRVTAHVDPAFVLLGNGIVEEQGLEQRGADRRKASFIYGPAVPGGFFFTIAVFFKWAFKSAAAVLIVTNTWTIVMGVFDAAQSVVASASGLIIGDTSINISSVMVGIEDRLMEMELGPLFGLWFQSLFVGITMWALTICIFIITFGRMIEIYLVTSVAPIPMATMMGKEWGGMGQNYIRSLLALGFQAFLIIVCVAIYAVLVQNIALVDDIIYAIWTCMGYTVLLCFCLFKTSSLAKSVFNAH